VTPRFCFEKDSKAAILDRGYSHSIIGFAEKLRKKLNFPFKKIVTEND